MRLIAIIRDCGYYTRRWDGIGPYAGYQLYEVIRKGGWQRQRIRWMDGASLLLVLFSDWFLFYFPFCFLFL